MAQPANAPGVDFSLHATTHLIALAVRMTKTVLKAGAPFEEMTN